MSVTVTMPQLGESVTEGTVTRWLKQVGETVQADEPLLEVSTDKVDTEIPAPASGVLLSIAAQEDDTVEVGGALGVIGEPGEAPAESAAPAAAPPAPEAPAPAPAPAPAAVAAAPAAPAVSAPPPAPAVAAPPSYPAVAPATAPSNIPPDPNPNVSGSQAMPGTESPVILPALGESVTEGTVTRWLKNVGDMVSADEPLLEVSTDKVDTEIPAPTSGTLLEIRVREDETAEVGQTLGIIGTPAPAGAPAASPEPPPAAAAAASGDAEIAATTPQPPAAPPAAAAPAFAPPSAPDVSAPPAPPAAEAAPEPSAGGTHAAAAPSDLYVTPLVRKLAAQAGVDLATVRGTGVGGRITKQDVFDASHAGAGAPPAPAAPAPAPAPGAPAAPAASAAAAPPAAPSAPTAPPAPARPATPSVPAAAPTPATAAAGETRTEKMSRLRKVIAERMVESLRVSAQLTSVVEADVTRIAALRTKNKSSFEAREGVKLSFMPFFAKATIEALKQFPVINASIDQEAGTVTYHGAIHLGIAVDTERGLLVPVVRDADNLNLAGLARKIVDVAERTRTNKVSPDELSGGTFTLTNTGSRGALFDTPIINQPQVAILGTGAIVRRPVVVTDETGADSIAIRSMVALALTYDHRLVDGADAARFLTALKNRLETGDFDAELG